MKPIVGLAFCCVLAAQTPEAAKATISNVGSEPTAYVPADVAKPADDYQSAFVTRAVAHAPEFRTAEPVSVETEEQTNQAAGWSMALRIASVFAPRVYWIGPLGWHHNSNHITHRRK